MQRLLLVGFIVTMTACQKYSVFSKTELLEYVTNPDNGYVSKLTKGDLELSLTYRPKDLIVEQFLNEINATTVDSIRRNLEDYEYFVLQFSIKGKEVENYYSSNPAQYNSLIDYLNSGIAQDIQIMDANPVSVHEILYSPSFGSSGKTSVMLVFKDAPVQQNNTLKIIFKDRFFGTGETEFTFKTKKIRNAPQLDVLNF